MGGYDKRIREVVLSNRTELSVTVLTDGTNIPNAKKGDVLFFAINEAYSGSIILTNAVEISRYYFNNGAGSSYAYALVVRATDDGVKIQPSKQYHPSTYFQVCKYSLVSIE